MKLSILCSISTLVCCELCSAMVTADLNLNQKSKLSKNTVVKSDLNQESKQLHKVSPDINEDNIALLHNHGNLHALIVPKAFLRNIPRYTAVLDQATNMLTYNEIIVHDYDIANQHIQLDPNTANPYQYVWESGIGWISDAPSLTSNVQVLFKPILTNVDTIINSPVTADGKTLLQIKIEYGYLDEVVHMLSQGNAKNKSRPTALSIATELQEGYLEENKVVDSEENQEVKLNVYDNCGWGALSYAVKNNSDVLFKLLLDNSAPINSPKDTISPLLVAVIDNNLSMAKQLIQNGANINAPILQNGLTALHVAIILNNIDMTKLFLDSNNDSETYINSTMIEFSGNNNTVNSLYFNILEPQESATMRLFHQKYITPDDIDYSIFDLDNLDIKVLNDKLTYEPTPNESDTDIDQCQGSILKKVLLPETKPIILAAALNHFDIVKLLMKHGAQYDNKVLLYACKYGKLSFIQKLLQHSSLNIKLNNTDSKENNLNNTVDDITPLMVTSFFGHFNITKYLVSQGANFVDTAKDGSSPYYLAAIQKHWDIIAFYNEQHAKLNKYQDKNKDKELNPNWTKIQSSGRIIPYYKNN